MTEKSYVIRLGCPDRPGIVAAVTTVLAGMGANILESNQFWDRQADHFFLRIAVTVAPDVTREAVEQALQPARARFGLDLTVADMARRPRIIVMVSKFDHAMHHLLYQIKVRWLHADVVAIVSNHEVARAAAAIEGVPFHHWPAKIGRAHV